MAMVLGVVTVVPLTATGEPSAAAEPPLPRVAYEPYLLKGSGGAETQAELGRLAVPLHRPPDGRTLELAFLRLPSTAERPGPPLVFLAGGPGGSGIDAAAGPLFPLFQRLRQVADVIALDPRGVGLSRPRPLCRATWRYPLDRPSQPSELLATARERSRGCAATLARAGFDLTAYQAEAGADDLEDLRRALGAERLDLWGFSFGTQLALVTLRRHPGSVRRVILGGVEGPGQVFSLPAEVDALLGRLAERLGEPQLMARLRAVRDRLAARPATVELDDPIAKRRRSITVGAFDLQLMAAQAMHGREALRALAADIAAMADGDFTSLARYALRRRNAWLGSAVPYAFKCAVGVNQDRLQAIREQRTSSLLGQAVDFPFPDICDAWELEALPPDFRRPVASPAPVLMISGTLDGRTSLSAAAAVARGLPGAVALVIEGAGHGPELFLDPSAGDTMLGFLRGVPIPGGTAPDRPEQARQNGAGRREVVVR